MLSKQEILSYIRATYREYQENDNYNDTFDDFINRRCENAAGNNKKIRVNGYNANIM